MLPPGTRRLFPHGEVELVRRDPETGRLPHAAWLIGRLLEDGDSEDLRWLAGEMGEAELARWLTERGRRQLSHRSRAFWELVLAPAAEPETAAEPSASRELWPL